MAGDPHYQGAKWELVKSIMPNYAQAMKEVTQKYPGWKENFFDLMNVEMDDSRALLPAIVC